MGYKKSVDSAEYQQLIDDVKRLAEILENIRTESMALNLESFQPTFGKVRTHIKGAKEWLAKTVVAQFGIAKALHMMDVEDVRNEQAIQARVAAAKEDFLRKKQAEGGKPRKRKAARNGRK